LPGAPVLFAHFNRTLRDYTVVVSPLQPAGSLFSAWAPSVCVLISDPDEVRELPSTIIQRLYGLTPAELRLCDHLVAGEAVEDVARKLDVAPATIRFHLAAVFRKTATNRQSDLVRLLLSVPLAGAALSE
jgi:DNA-binding CsgD family transcriptional regulator